MEKKTLGDTINKLFNRPKKAFVEHDGEKIEFFVKPAGPEVEKEYSRLIAENKADEAILHLMVSCVTDEQGTPAWDSADKVNLTTEMKNSFATVIMQKAFNLNLKLTEFETKNFPDSPSSEAVSS
jgi:hypothetical protein